MVERFDARDRKVITPGKTADIPIPDGKGLPLAEHPRVVRNLTKEANSDLKVIFSAG